MAGRYRYQLAHFVSGEDRESLESGLEGEPGFRLAELVGADAVRAMISDGEWNIDLTVSDRFFGFGPSLEILSVYLPEYVIGVEVAEELDLGLKRTRVECWRYIGRQGELLVVPLQYALSMEREVIPGKEDLAALRRMWRELPQWARDGYKLSYGELADLDSGG